MHATGYAFITISAAAADDAGWRGLGGGASGLEMKMNITVRVGEAFGATVEPSTPAGYASACRNRPRA